MEEPRGFDGEVGDGGSGRWAKTESRGLVPERRMSDRVEGLVLGEDGDAALAIGQFMIPASDTQVVLLEDRRSFLVYIYF